MYLPFHNVAERKYLFKLSVTKLSFFTVSLPLIAFLSCVVLTMVKDFENANNTHCKVPNIFPSISASIGNYEPQSTIWRTALYIHAPLRFFIIYLRWVYYSNVITKDLYIIVNSAVTLNIIENAALLGLTHWTSSENYPYHEVCFKTFIAASIIYMSLVCLLLTNYKRRSNVNLERYSIKLKWRAFITNVTSFACAAFFFLRHNSLCEPYVYSLFGFSEYIVVLSNIGFHMTTAFDLQSQYMKISERGITFE